MSMQINDGLSVLAAMATPAVLLLANAMLILSTNQRLQSILSRVREVELSIAGADAIREITDLSLLNELLLGHARRAKAAHRALLCLYGSAGMFVVVVVCVGLASLGAGSALAVALAVAFLGCASLLGGALLLIGETWIGIRATDQRFISVMNLCEELSRHRDGEDAGKQEPA
jgi:hypothetical protein